MRMPQVEIIKVRDDGMGWDGMVYGDSLDVGVIDNHHHHHWASIGPRSCYHGMYEGICTPRYLTEKQIQVVPAVACKWGFWKECQVGCSYSKLDFGP